MSIETPNQCMTAQYARTLLDEGLSCQVESDLPAPFKVGKRVKAKVIPPKTYTRLPRYIRGKVGEIVKDYGVYVFPDTMGQRLSQKPQHVYSVRFAAQELWGQDVWLFRIKYANYRPNSWSLYPKGFSGQTLYLSILSTETLAL